MSPQRLPFRHISRWPSGRLDYRVMLRHRTQFLATGRSDHMPILQLSQAWQRRLPQGTHRVLRDGEVRFGSDLELAAE